MKTGMQTSTIAVIGLAFLLASPGAFAYLDPSTGSMVISAVVGIFASIALALKTYWYKIKSILRRDSKKDDSAEQSAD